MPARRFAPYPGFTLIEILVAFGIILVVAALVIPMFGQFKIRRICEGVAETMAQDVRAQQARARALDCKRSDSTSCGLQLQPDGSYQIYEMDAVSGSARITRVVSPDVLYGTDVTLAVLPGPGHSPSLLDFYADPSVGWTGTVTVRVSNASCEVRIETGGVQVVRQW